MNENSREQEETGLEFSDLGQALKSLGQNLTDLGDLSTKPTWDPRDEMAFEDLDYVDQLIINEQRANQRHDAMVQMLNGMRKFRSEYEHLERLVANFAMNDMGFSQRRTGTLLGFSGATMNRLSQASRESDE